MLPLLRPDPGSTDPLLLLLAALLIDAVIGDPAWLYGYLPHPVALIGQMIAALERRLNLAERSDRVRRALGILTVVLVVCLAAGLGAFGGGRLGLRGGRERGIGQSKDARQSKHHKSGGEMESA